MSVNFKEYIGFVKESLENESTDVVEVFNKMALKMGAITVEQYSQAADLIVEKYMINRFGL